MAERAADPVADLVRRAQAGDRDAFDLLYEHAVGRIYALCRRMSDGEAEAVERTQDVFVRAWQKLAAYRFESAFTTWLHAIAVNLILTERRSTRRRLARVLAPAEPSVLEHATARPDPATERIDLERAIAALPEGARLVLVLHEIHGYSHEEIARMTGAAVGTMRAQLHRARTLLKERLS